MVQLRQVYHFRASCLTKEKITQLMFFILKIKTEGKLRVHKVEKLENCQTLYCEMSQSHTRILSDHLIGQQASFFEQITKLSFESEVACDDSSYDEDNLTKEEEVYIIKTINDTKAFMVSLSEKLTPIQSFTNMKIYTANVKFWPFKSVSSDLDKEILTMAEFLDVMINGNQ